MVTGTWEAENNVRENYIVGLNKNLKKEEGNLPVLFAKVELVPCCVMKMNRRATSRCSKGPLHVDKRPPPELLERASSATTKHHIACRPLMGL